MAPQAYAHLIRQLAALHWQHLQVSAEPDPSRTSLRQALAQDQALHQVHTQALLDFCTRLAARARTTGRPAQERKDDACHNTLTLLRPTHTLLRPTHGQAHDR